MPRLIDAHSAQVSIRAVSDCIVLSCEWLNGYKTGLDAAVAAIDGIPTIEVPQWIPVTEGLPEDGELVVAIVNGNPRKNIRLIGAYKMATYYRDEGWVVELYPDWENADVTHWMTLPESPEDGGRT